MFAVPGRCGTGGERGQADADDQPADADARLARCLPPADGARRPRSAGAHHPTGGGSAAGPAPSARDRRPRCVIPRLAGGAVRSDSPGDRCPGTWPDWLHGGAALTRGVRHRPGDERPGRDRLPGDRRRHGRRRSSAWCGRSPRSLVDQDSQGPAPAPAWPARPSPRGSRP